MVVFMGDYTPFFLSAPASEGAVISSTLEMIWLGVFALIAIFFAFLAGRKKLDFSSEGVACFFFFGVFVVGYETFEPLLWTLFESMPDGPAWVAETTTLVIYSVVMMSLCIFAAVQASRLGEKSKDKGS